MTCSDNDTLRLSPCSSSACHEALAQLRHDIVGSIVDMPRGKLPRSVVKRRGLGLQQAWDLHGSLA